MSKSPSFPEASRLAGDGSPGDLARLADVGELAGPLAHEVNNYLNCVLLHVAVLETEVPAELKPELESLRQLSTDMAALVARFQDYRRRNLASGVTGDLNAVVRRLTSGESVFKLCLTPGLLPVPVATADLDRLAAFLIGQALAMGGTVTIRTEQDDQHVVFCIEDGGPTVPPAALPRYFDPGAPQRPGVHGLELAACRSIVTRTGGRITASNLRERGLAVQVRWPRTNSATPDPPAS